MESALRLGKDIIRSLLVLALTAMPVVAMADVVAVVSAKSAVTTLSKSQITDIFLGKTTRFPDGSPAVPIDQSEGTLARDEFYSAFTGESAAQLKAHWSKIIFTGRGQPPKTVPNSVAMRKLVAENPAAIGYIDASLMDETLMVTMTGQ
jgi:ABC-type phosphate transport system substrate-binding protein